MSDGDPEQNAALTAATGPTDVVAIDGPSGAGKSTVARTLADRLGFAFLDTGAMYRAITWRFLERGCAPSECAGEPDRGHARMQAVLAATPLTLRRGRVLVGDGEGGQRDVTTHLRTREVESQVSAVSALPFVRERMRDLQRQIAAVTPTVAEGRDMGSVVFPRARWKVYLDAAPGERARRRSRDFRSQGRRVDETQVLEEILVRDRLDSTRDDAPLMRSDDALYIDTTGLTLDDVVGQLLEFVGERPDASGAARTGADSSGAAQTVRRANAFWYYLSKFFVWSFSKLYFRLRVEGREHWPADGPVIIVANHSSYLDPPMVGISAPRVVLFLAQAGLAKFAPARWWMSKVGVTLIDREAPSKAALRLLSDSLAAGQAVGIFPEGTRSKDGQIGQFQSGVEFLVRRTKATVLPVGLDGPFRAYPRKAWFPRPRKIVVRWGRTWTAEEVLAPGGVERLRQTVAELAHSDLKVRRRDRSRAVQPDSSEHSPVEASSVRVSSAEQTRSSGPSRQSS